ncbi:MAG: hypothetical protein K8I29_14840 [Alphaproteobacteria bacterium]|uniref:Glycine zipper domain-containing protein n=1 Tax=Candidatus Nitrobium versatile TaxID=2884831 RepID=A0A953M291_9BACT|nr:hypothetical protein [Candidatus Nitrobium versatile]
MIKAKYLLWLGISSAAGAATGILSHRKSPEQGGLIGAAVGFLAGSLAVEMHRRLADEDDGISYYSKSSPLYEDFDEAEYL